MASEQLCKLFYLVSFGMVLSILIRVSPTACDTNIIETKIDAEVKENAQSREPYSIIVESEFSNSPDILPGLRKTFSEVKSQDNGLTTAVQKLINSTAQNFAPVVELLEKENVKYVILPITNSLHIHGPISESLLDRIASFKTVMRIRPDLHLPIDLLPTMPTLKPPARRPFGNKTWNIGLIDGRCRTIKRLGTGVTIGIIDSGVMYNHTELEQNWLGNVHQDYGWFDATANETASAFPTDPLGSGTKTLGIAVGKNIGVAPDATWTTCRACNGTVCSLAALETCALYMACPWKWNDSSKRGDCSLGAKIVLFVLGTNYRAQIIDPLPLMYYKIVQFWNIVGLLPVFDMGDTGPDCNSAKIPGGYDISLSVGAVDENADISDGSSRGPILIAKQVPEDSTAESTCPALTNKKICTDASDNASICTIYKPDLVAPGYNVNTSTNANSTSYDKVSATNVAAAHVAGALALMISANPQVNWNYKLAYKILTETADISRIDQHGNRENDSEQYFPVGSHLLCNMIMSGICTGFPDNVYGWGILNACNAVRATLKLKV